MHKRGIIRYANYTVCASVFIHFCMQRKHNENIPILKRGNMSSHVKIFSYNFNVARQNKCCGTVLCNLVSHLSKMQRGRAPSF